MTVFLLSGLTGFADGLDVKESACKARDTGSIPGMGTYSGEGNGYPLQSPRLENSMDRGAWRAIVCGGHKKSDTTEHLSQGHNKDL